jgi:hypothetical protein
MVNMPVLSILFNKINSKNKNAIFLIIQFLIVSSISIYLYIFYRDHKQYNLYFYEQFPQLFWITIIISLISIYVYQLYYSNKSNGNIYLYVSFLLLFIWNVLLLSVPLIMNFSVYGRGDTLTHIGFIVDIVLYGNISLINEYPVIHLLAAALTFTTGVSIEKTSILLPIIFSLCFIIFIFACSKKFYKFYKGTIFLMILGSSLLFSSYHLLLSPYSQAVLFSPIIIFILLYFIANKSKASSLLILIIGLMIIFLHPLFALIFIIVLMCINIYIYINNKFSLKNSGGYNSIIWVTLFITTTYLFMNIENFLALNSMYKFINFSLGSLKPSEYQTAIDIVQSTNVEYMRIIKAIIYKYGTYFLLFFLSILMLYNIVDEFLKKRFQQSLLLIFNVLIISIVMYLISAFTLFIYLDFGASRLYKAGFVLSILVLPQYLNICLFKDDNIYHYKYIKIIFILSIIIFLTILSIYSLYPAPNNGFVNQQIVKSEYQSLNTFYRFNCDHYDIVELGLESTRYFHAFNGIDESSRKGKLAWDYRLIKDHFGYDNYNNISSTYIQPTYFIDLIFQSKILPDPILREKYLDRFNESSFNLFNNDLNIIRFYDNGELRMYLISTMSH